MRKSIVVLTVLAVSLIGSAEAQQTAGVTTVKIKANDMGFETTGEVAERAKAEIMAFEKEKEPLLLKGGDFFANFFDRVDATDVLIIGGDGELHSEPDHLELWRTGTLTQQNEIQYEHQLHIYDNGRVGVMTYLSVTQMTRGGKEQVHFGRLTDVWLKAPDGRWLRVVHAGSGKDR